MEPRPTPSWLRTALLGILLLEIGAIVIWAAVECIDEPSGSTRAAGAEIGAGLIFLPILGLAGVGLGILARRRRSHGNVLNVVLGTEYRAAVGVPIAGAIIVYPCTGRPRRFFTARDRPEA